MPFTRLHGALLAGCITCAWSPASAHAQSASPSPAPASASASPGPTPESSNNLRSAQEHTASALTFFRAGDYRPALHEFELANEAAPAADFLYNIGRCHEELREYAEAATSYTQYLRDKVDPPDRADVEHRIAEMHRRGEQQRMAARLQRTTASIQFHMAHVPAGARVYVGDRMVGRTPLPDEIQSVEGTFPVRVVAPGMQEWRGQVRVHNGPPADAFVAMEPATRYVTRSHGHIVSYVLAALTLGTFGTGVGFGVSATQQSQCFVGMACERRDQSTDADVLFGVAAGLAITTAIVWFIEAGSAQTDRVTAPLPP